MRIMEKKTMADLTKDELDEIEARVRELENMLRFLLEDYGCDMRDEEVESIRRLLEKQGEKPKEEEKP